MLVSKEFIFHAAHYLPQYHGKCERLHGHSYRLRITVAGEPDVEGMICDFGEMKKIVKRQVIDRLDHTLVNDLIPNPTAELMTWWMWTELEHELPLAEVRLWETADNIAVLTAADAEKAKKMGAVPEGFALTAEIQKWRNEQGWGCERCQHADDVQVLDD